VLKAHSLPEQLWVLANDLSVQKHPSISDLFNQAYERDMLPGKIMNAIPTNGSLKEITKAECAEQAGRVQCRGKQYVPESDQLWLRLIQ